MNAHTQCHHKPDKRRPEVWVLLGLLTLLPACSSPTPVVNLPPVGPAPLHEVLQPNQGTLVVYSEYNLFGDPRYIQHHSDYTIASQDGKMVRQVANHLDHWDEGPQPVALPAGKYTVTARSAYNGKVNVPVQIEVERTTYVYLDGYPHPNSPAAKQSNAVKLPDGQIVGWSASAASK